MKQTLFSVMLVLMVVPAIAQITITASDMPVNGDTLRYSIANPAAASINLSDSGTNKAWNFSSLAPIAQGVDTFKSAAQVNASYGFTISPTAYGTKVADSLPGAPIPVKEIYNFFNKKTGPSRYVTEGFAAKFPARRCQSTILTRTKCTFFRSAIRTEQTAPPLSLHSPFLAWALFRSRATARRGWTDGEPLLRHSQRHRFLLYASVHR